MPEKLRSLEDLKEGKIAKFFRSRIMQLLAAAGVAATMSSYFSYEAGRSDGKKEEREAQKTELVKRENDLRERFENKYPYKYKTKGALDAACWDIGPIKLCPTKKSSCKKQKTAEELVEKMSDEELKVFFEKIKDKVEEIERGELEELLFNVDFEKKIFNAEKIESDYPEMKDTYLSELVEKESEKEATYIESFLGAETEKGRHRIYCEMISVVSDIDDDFYEGISEDEMKRYEGIYTKYESVIDGPNGVHINYGVYEAMRKLSKYDRIENNCDQYTKPD